MIVMAARHIRDGDVLMVGTQWPIPVALLAKNHHAPQCTLCFEGGLVLEDMPERIPLLTADSGLPSATSCMGDCMTALGTVLHGGRADLAVLTAAHVDRYGNLNTTGVGPYKRPTMRFGGSGGACDFGSLAKRSLIIVEHKRFRFPSAVDFITTPGPSLGRPGHAKMESKRATHPRHRTVVTTMAQFACREGEELALTGYRSDLRPADIQASMQWEVPRSPGCGPLPDPTSLELHLLRDKVDPSGLYLQNRKQAPMSFRE